jgi:hypothetical protein
MCGTVKARRSNLASAESSPCSLSKSSTSSRLTNTCASMIAARFNASLGQRVRSPRRDAEHLSCQVGQDDVSPRREPGDGQPRLARARGNVKMLLITSDVKTLDYRRADRA